MSIAFDAERAASKIKKDIGNLVGGRGSVLEAWADDWQDWGVRVSTEHAALWILYSFRESSKDVRMGESPVGGYYVCSSPKT